MYVGSVEVAPFNCADVRGDCQAVTPWPGRRPARKRRCAAGTDAVWLRPYWRTGERGSELTLPPGLPAPKCVFLEAQPPAPKCVFLLASPPSPKSVFLIGPAAPSAWAPLYPGSAITGHQKSVLRAIVNACPPSRAGATGAYRLASNHIRPQHCD